MNMFQRILVPLDGSMRAEHAIPVAARIARSTGGTLLLLRAVGLPFQQGATLTQPDVLTDKESQAEINEAHTYLSHVLQMDVLEGIGTSTQVITGAVIPAILSFANPSKTDLIVMCSHGHTGLTRWFLGSVADKLARHAEVPVFILRESDLQPPSSPVELGQHVRALVTVDGSAHSETVILPVAHLVSALAAPNQGELHLVHVVDNLTMHGHTHSQANSDGDMRQQAEEDAKVYLRYLSNRTQKDGLADLNLTMTTSVVADPDVAGAIVQIGEGLKIREKADEEDSFVLIAMTTHGRGGLERWALGSITERVLHGTRLPLFIVHAQKPAFMKETQTAASSDLQAAEGPAWSGLL
jgi:nucleotide-binding universal stress UspA family protein